MFLAASGAWNGYSIIEPDDLGMDLGGGTQLGWAVAALGDANADGFIDVAVSSIGQTLASPHPEGAVHVAHLSQTGAVVGYATVNGSGCCGAAFGDNFGRGIVAVGDWVAGVAAVTGQAQDVLVGSPGQARDADATVAVGCVHLVRAEAFGLAGSDSLSGGSGGGGALWASNGSAPKVCAPDVLAAAGLPSDSDGARGLGHSLAHLGARWVAVGAPSAHGGAGALWLLSLTVGLGVDGGGDDPTDDNVIDPSGSGSGAGRRAGSGFGFIELDTSALGLVAGDNFGSSVAALAGSTLVGGGGPGGLDLDGSAATLDLAVGAEGLDGTELDSGAVFILTVHAASGTILRHFRIASLNGVPYYTGGSIGNMIDRRDKFGASVACIGDLNGDGNLELTVGLPGYGRYAGNNRGGAWATLFLKQLVQPTGAPAAAPTLSGSPTLAPTLSPSPSPTATTAPSPDSTLEPSAAPSGTSFPSQNPTRRPAPRPSRAPTHAPTHAGRSHGPTVGPVANGYWATDDLLVDDGKPYKGSMAVQILTYFLLGCVTVLCCYGVRGAFFFFGVGVGVDRGKQNC